MNSRCSVNPDSVVAVDAIGGDCGKAARIVERRESSSQCLFAAAKAGSTTRTRVIGFVVVGVINESVMSNFNCDSFVADISVGFRRR